ncbi:MAG: peptidase S24 [Oscillospiraceae bacterium]|nr:peptidase S24 [Oscillospiraceae bacterium]
MGEIIKMPSGGYNAALDRENNVIGRRIAAFRKERSLSLAAFGEKLERYGVSVGAGAIHKWEKGESAPNAYQLLAIGEAFALEDTASAFKSNAQPALNEEGLKKLAEYRRDLVASGRYAPRRTAEKAIIEYIDMPVSALRVSAGTGAFLDDEDFVIMSFPAATVPRGADFGVRISGDSMEPVYHHGQIVWVHRCESVEVGQVGVFVYEGEGYLKVYGEQMPEEYEMENFTDSYGICRPQPVMISYNRAYEMRKISPEGDFRVVGRVL